MISMSKTPPRRELRVHHELLFHKQFGVVSAFSGPDLYDDIHVGFLSSVLGRAAGIAPVTRSTNWPVSRRAERT